MTTILDIPIPNPNIAGHLQEEFRKSPERAAALESAVRRARMRLNEELGLDPYDDPPTPTVVDFMSSTRLSLRFGATEVAFFDLDENIPLYDEDPITHG